MWFRPEQTSGLGGSRALGFARRGGIDRLIARLNIEHFRRLLSEEKDEPKRQILLHLLAQEKAKLAALDSPPEPPEKED